jgi:hypothetical protein
MKPATLALAALLATSGPSTAVTWNEIGDAPGRFGSQQVIGGGYDSISGVLDWHDLSYDLYQFSIGDVGGLTIGMTGTFDGTLALFDGAGAGLLSDDDSGPGLHPQITTGPLSAGTYLLGVMQFWAVARDTDGRSWNTGFSANAPAPGSFGTLGELQSLFGVTGGTYEISLGTTTVDIAPVPIPASALMLLAGLGGFAALRRRG